MPNLLGLAISAVILAGCELFIPLRESQLFIDEASSEEAKVVNIAASWAAAPLVGELEEIFKARYPDVVVSIEVGESRLAAQKAVDGRVDLAFHLDELQDPAAEAGNQVQTPPEGRLIAYDALVVVVSANSTVNSLSLSQLRDVYSGRVFRWQQLGGDDSLVEFISREKGSATRDFFEERVMQGEPVSTASLVLPSDEAVADYVSRNPGSIGYISMAYTDVRLKVIKLDGNEPSEALVRTGTYPLVRRIVAALSDSPSVGAQRLLAIASSEEGCQAAARHNVCPRSVK